MSGTTKHLHFFFRAMSLIFLWRGTWHLMDLYLFPSNPLYSNLASLLIGAVLIIFSDTILAIPASQETPAEKKKETEYAPQE